MSVSAYLFIACIAVATTCVFLLVLLKVKP